MVSTMFVVINRTIFKRRAFLDVKVIYINVVRYIEGGNKSWPSKLPVSSTNVNGRRRSLSFIVSVLYIYMYYICIYISIFSL